jgi:hypothetical protein
MITHLLSLGYPMTDADLPLPVYVDSKVCVKWCHNLTTKGNWHIEHRKKVVKEWVKDGHISISHISRKTLLLDIFTKEMRDGFNIRCLRNSFMSHGTTFLQHLQQPASILLITGGSQSTFITDIGCTTRLIHSAFNTRYP